MIFKVGCNQKFAGHSSTYLDIPGVQLEHPALGISVILYTDHAMDCLKDATDKEQTEILDLKEDSESYSALMFIRP